MSRLLELCTNSLIYEQNTGKPEEQAFLMRVFDNYMIDGKQPKESEDCLYLNVYAPPSASPTNRKAVIFWIYGASTLNTSLIGNAVVKKY